MVVRRSFAACAALVCYVVFLATVAFGAPCDERCPDDGPDGRCPPVCVTCPCSPRPAPLAAAPRVSAPVARHESVRELVILAPDPTEPADIFHVPKRFLA